MLAGHRPRKLSEGLRSISEREALTRPAGPRNRAAGPLAKSASMRVERRAVRRRFASSRAVAEQFTNLLNLLNNPIGEWCNGSTTDSDSVCLGSNPGSPANSTIPDIAFLQLKRHRTLAAPLGGARLHRNSNPIVRQSSIAASTNCLARAGCRGSDAALPTSGRHAMLGL